jgi:hypothetical protein
MSDVLDAGISSELLAAFMLVADAEVAGEPKFTHKVYHELRKAIVCRTYASPIFELCHLVRIADACSSGAGYENFFWGGGVAQASSFHAQVTMAGDMPFCKVSGTGVELRYPDGQFTVNYGRMPYLSAVMEFLLNVLGYETLNRALNPITETDVVQDTVSVQANELSKALYNYLNEHLPPVQAQQKFRLLITFLNDERGPDFQISDIDDECIMAFWERVSGEAGDGGIDFKTFSATFKAFVRLCQVLLHAPDLHGLEHAAPIGSDWDAGEINPEQLSELLEDVSEELNPLLALDEGPSSAIKFLNKREFEALETLFETGKVGLGLPLSVMRYETFGKGQGRITQALRRKVVEKELQDLMNNCAVSTFEEKGAELYAVDEHIERVLLASLHVFLSHRDEEALSLMLTLAPDADLTPLKSLISKTTDEEEYVNDGNVVLLRLNGVADAVIDAVADPAQVGGDLAGLVQKAGEAFDGLSRKGFRQEDVKDSGVRDGIAEGVNHLIQVRGSLRKFLKKFEAFDLPKGGWARQFDADSPRFARQFQFLYGEKL